MYFELRAAIPFPIGITGAETVVGTASGGIDDELTAVFRIPRRRKEKLKTVVLPDILSVFFSRRSTEFRRFRFHGTEKEVKIILVAGSPAESLLSDRLIICSVFRHQIKRFHLFPERFLHFAVHNDFLPGGNFRHDRIPVAVVGNHLPVVRGGSHDGFPEFFIHEFHTAERIRVFGCRRFRSPEQSFDSAASE